MPPLSHGFGLNRVPLKGWGVSGGLPPSQRVLWGLVLCPWEGIVLHCLPVLVWALETVGWDFPGSQSIVCHVVIVRCAGVWFRLLQKYVYEVLLKSYHKVWHYKGSSPETAEIFYESLCASDDM